MTDKLFDDYIREKLKNHTSDVPAGMWDQIVHEKSNNKKGIFWWETMGALMLLGCMATFFGWFDPLDNHSTEKKITSNKTGEVSLSKQIQPILPQILPLASPQNNNGNAVKNNDQLVSNDPTGNAVMKKVFSAKENSMIHLFRPRLFYQRKHA